MVLSGLIMVTCMAVGLYGAERFRVRMVGRVHQAMVPNGVRVTVEFPEGAAQQSSASVVQALRAAIALEEAMDREVKP
jgi:hypothetical protein